MNCIDINFVLLGFVVFCILWMIGYGVEFVMEILIYNISRLLL